MRARYAILVFAIGASTGGAVARSLFANDVTDRSVVGSIEALACDVRALAAAQAQLAQVQRDSPDAASPVRSEAGAERSSALDSADGLAALTERIETVLNRALESAAGDAASPPTQPIPQNKSAVLALRQDVAASDEVVTGRHFCWSRHQVYRAYGMPNSVTRSGQSITWEYYPDQSRDGIVFDFEDGLVTRVYPWQSPNPRNQ
jgi:hypothetical protein